MSVTDEYLKNNEAYASTFEGPLPLPPSKHVAVVACMDARLDVYRILGLGDGEAHVIRNAGGVVTDDEIRSLAISQRLLGTKEIILIHHTDCGMLTFTDDEFKRTIQDDTGIKPEWAAEAFTISKRTCVSRCAASRQARSSPSMNRCAASSSTSPPEGSTRSGPRKRLRGAGLRSMMSRWSCSTRRPPTRAAPPCSSTKPPRCRTCRAACGTPFRRSPTTRSSPTARTPA